jgi:uncharacterized membrane protein
VVAIGSCVAAHDFQRPLPILGLAGPGSERGERHRRFAVRGEIVRRAFVPFPPDDAKHQLLGHHQVRLVGADVVGREHRQRNRGVVLEASEAMRRPVRAQDFELQRRDDLPRGVLVIRSRTASASKRTPDAIAACAASTNHAAASPAEGRSTRNYNERMLVLRYAHLLALVVWLGGMVILGAIVAPTVFQVLPMREPEAGRLLAGAVFGAALGRFHYVAYACGAVLLVTLILMAVLGPRPAQFAVRSALAAIMLGIAVYSGVVVLGSVERLQREIGLTVAPSTLPDGDARRVRFDQLHALSTRLMLVNIVGALVLLYWEARE